MNDAIELKKFVEKQPWTAVTGAALVGFAFGSGMAMPILMGAGMSRAVLRSTLKTWLATQVRQGLQDLWRTQASAIQVPAKVEQHGDSDSGGPGETSLARQVSRELG